jgi:uncharacterized protein (UPF0333 family)
MYKKKGQAALEFLMTYGWAILAAIIVIGALGSYFYLSQGTSTNVFLNAPFYSFSASATSGVTAAAIRIEVANNGRETLKNVVMDVTMDGNTCTSNQLISFPSNSRQIFDLDCTTALVENSNLNGKVDIEYFRPGSNLALKSTGSVTTPVV